MLGKIKRLASTVVGRSREPEPDPEEVRQRALPATGDVTDEEISLIVPILKRVIAGPLAIRESIQKHGVNVLPIDYRVDTPSIEEIRSSFEYANGGVPPYLNEKVFNARKMAGVLKRISKYAEEFRPDVEGNDATNEGFYWNNPMFSYSDAIAYYCFIRHYRPKTIVEIGSGHSTRIALEATRRNGLGKIVCVEPYPRAFLKNNRDIELIARPAQAITVADLDRWLCEEGDFLFIDSTHMVKTGSDCAHIYLRLLPRVRRRIVVHAHDIFLPFGMPQTWALEQQISWTEQYLLFALLIDNPRASVLFGSAYHDVFSKIALAAMMGGKYPSGGGSLWFDYNPDKRLKLLAPVAGRFRNLAKGAKTVFRGRKRG
jgi:hypothetical protein